VKDVGWLPMGLQPQIYDPALTYEDVLNGERDIDIFMMIDRTSPWRRERMDRMNEAFPNGHFYGKGWKRGYLPPGREAEYLKKAKIGPNFHNSTGPINFRTFYLPANGVMLLCDNKRFLGQIYELDIEAVGFDDVKECIELCEYYISHDKERREIAARGWKRAISDYNEIAVFDRLVRHIEKNRLKVTERKKTDYEGIVADYRRTIKIGTKIRLRMLKLVLIPVGIAVKIIRKVRRLIARAE
jgi:spore maturation protein CgeB